jgi:2-dehydro-3-deoxyglucarate aldolase
MRLCWQQIPSTVISDILCHNSLDGVVLDTEHSAFNSETLYACIQVIALNGKKCFVRLTEVNKTTIRMCLDAGCHGIIFSTIETERQAQEVSDFTRYPNQGGRRGLGLVRQNTWGLKKLVTNPPILIAQIETIAGVKNVNNIWNKDVFDYCMIGPYDLSASLGDPGNFETKDFINAVNSVKDCVGIEKMSVHIPDNVENQLKKYKDFGIIALGMDTTFIIEKYREIENA